MTRLLRLACLVVLTASGAWAAERFPPPQFENHQLPVTTTPAPRAASLDGLDIAVLAAALGGAAYLVLRRRSRRGIVGLGLFSLLYFGFWRKGCVCPVGSVQNVVTCFADPGYAVPVVVAVFFLLPLVFALFFGRVFCAAVCPLGMAQDLVVVRPVAVPRWLAEGLGLLPVLYLAVAVLLAATGSAYVVCQYDPFVGFFRRSAELPMLVFGGALLLLGLCVARPYCRFLCPYGVLLGWLSRFSRRHATITPDECIHCRLCEDSCPFGAIEKPVSEWTGLTRSAGRKALAAAVLSVPLLALGGGGVGFMLSGPLSRANATVRLAERVWLENAGQADGATVASAAFRGTGRPEQDLYREALEVRGRIGHGAAMAGAFVGLVIGGRLIQLSVRRRRPDYEPDRALCLSCGRCFLFCPREHVRLKKIEDLQCRP